MRKKYCTLHNKAVYAKICLDCGRLKQTEKPVRKIGTLFERREDGIGVLTDCVTFETPGWECEHLFEKVVFKGPYTDSWRKRTGHHPEPSVGTLEKYQYGQSEIDAYSK